jgi:hypothetical protein
MTQTRDNHVRILFSLKRDETGYPPVDWERLWAIPKGDQLYELDNIPFFALDVASADLVAVSENSAGELIFGSVAVSGMHSTIRVIMFDLDAKDATMKTLESLGCQWEGSHLPKLCAIDVPPQVDYELVMDFLNQRAGDGVLDYEEAAVRH